MTDDPTQTTAPYAPQFYDLTRVLEAEIDCAAGWPKAKAASEAAKADARDAEIERLRTALREIARLDHTNSNWAPGMATRALGGKYEHSGSV